MKKKTEIEVENDESIEKKEEESPIIKKEIEIGSYKQHFDTAKRGINEYHIWDNLTHALLCMAQANSYHRVDLRDKEFLKKIAHDFEEEINYSVLNYEILKRPFLISLNDVKVKIEMDKTKDENGKTLTKKALKTNERREKIQKKINVLQKKYDDMKSHKGPRAEGLKTKINELEMKKDHM